MRVVVHDDREVVSRYSVTPAHHEIVYDACVFAVQQVMNGGVGHLAVQIASRLGGSADIYQAVETMAARDVKFQDTPDTYYEQLDARVPGHGENLQRLRADRILVDGAPTEGQGLLLQIFTQNMIGPIFFELIQRKGNEGFGEGNFRALFESIEADQIRRGVLPAKKG